MRGKNTEALVREALKLIQDNHRAFVHRFYDTGSARSILPAQPGDFMLVYPAGAVLIEVKESVKHDSLVALLKAEGKVASRQIAKHRLWYRAGQPSVFIFRKNEEVEVYEGREICDCYLGYKEANPALSGSTNNLYVLLIKLMEMLDDRDRSSKTLSKD